MEPKLLKAAIFDIRGYAVPPPKNPDDWENWFGDRKIRVFNMQKAIPPARAIVKIFENLAALLAYLKLEGISPRETVYFSDDNDSLRMAISAGTLAVVIPPAKDIGDANYWLSPSPSFFDIIGAINFLKSQMEMIAVRSCQGHSSTR